MAPRPLPPPIGGDGLHHTTLTNIDERKPLLEEGVPTLNYTENNDHGDDSSEKAVASDNDDDDDDDEDDARTTATEGTVLEAIVETFQDTVGTIVEGTSDMLDGVTEVVHDIADEFIDAKDILVEGLEEADEGELFFLDMGLVRGLSILPSDIAAVAANDGDMSVIDGHGTNDYDEDHGTEAPSVAVPGGDVDDKKQSTTPSRIPIVAYLLLVTAVVSLSSIGPLLDLQDNASGSMKIFWRMTGTAILLFPLAAHDVYHYGRPKLTGSNLVIFFASTFFYDVMCVGFVLALEYTAVGNAVILANSQALLLLVGKLFVGSPVLFMEGAGAVVAFFGAVLCSKDSAEGSENAGNALLGDGLALFSALGGVGYLVFAKQSRNHMSLYVYMFLTMAVGALMIIPFQIVIMRETVTFDMNINHGIGGFLNLTMDRLPLEFVMVLVCNIGGTVGYVRALTYFDSIVIATAGLMEPVIAEFMAFALGVSSLPGIQGWIGNLLVFGGTVAVVYPASQSGNSAAAH